MTASIGDGANFVAGRPEFLFAGYDLGFGGTANFDVTPDGQRFVMLQTEGSGPPQLRVVQHWVEELTRLVPTVPTTSSDLFDRREENSAWSR